MQGYNVNFWEQKLSTWKFIFKERKDKTFMMTNKIAWCLPEPNLSHDTELAAKALTFDVNLLH
jgi:hypothetical protein